MRFWMLHFRGGNFNTSKINILFVVVDKVPDVDSYTTRICDELLPIVVIRVF